MKRGLADEIVPPEKLLDLAIENAERLAALRPAAFALTKQQMRQPVADALDRHGKRLDAATPKSGSRRNRRQHARLRGRTFKKS